MKKVIVYKQDSGVLAIITPADEALVLYGIEAISLKDVPHGKPFKIVDAADIPEDRSDRNFWTADDADLTDGIGAEWSSFPENIGDNGGPAL